MAGDLAYEASLLIKIHALEIRFVVGEDLVGLWDNPDLQPQCKHRALRRTVI